MFIQLKYQKLVIVIHQLCFYKQLHIFNGDNNYGKHIIYDITTKQIKIKNDHEEAKNIENEHIIIHNNQIIRFGGYKNGGKFLDDFFISNINNNNDDYQWMKQSKYNLSIPLESGGYILYNDYLIIFGGQTIDYEYIDDIYILNLNNSSLGNEWTKSKIKLPFKSKYHAILNNKMVHIIKCHDWDNDNSSHHNIHISSILGDLYKKNRKDPEKKKRNQM